jgi:hypothetical protein
MDARAALDLFTGHLALGVVLALSVDSPFVASKAGGLI